MQGWLSSQDNDCLVKLAEVELFVKDAKVAIFSAMLCRMLWK